MKSWKKIRAHSNRRIRLHRFGVLAGIAIASQLVWFAAAPSHESHRASTPLQSAARALVGRHSNRPVYPYSIIPGGVESAAELREAVANDPVVAAHYVGFDFDHTHIVRLAEVRAAFVSYRKGNRVFWTSKRLRLPAGETLITDGVHSARTRCANQVSDTPRSPIAPDGEPSPKTLTTPLVTGNIEQPPIDFPLKPPPATGTLPLVGGGGTGGIPPGGPIIVGGGGGSGGNPPGGPIIGGGGGGNSPVPNPPSPVPIATPEPGTLLLTATGLCVAWLARKLKKS